MTLRAGHWLRATRIGCLVIVGTIGGGAMLAEEKPVVAPEMRADIERLMEVTNAYDADLAEQMAVMVSQQIGEVMGLKTSEAMERCREIAAQSIGEMFTDRDFVEEMNAVYAKHFSHEDIRQMIAFYETPAGKKSVEAMPQLMSDSMQLTMRWMARMNPVIRERVAKAIGDEGLVE